MPACISQQRCDPTVAIPAVLPGQFDHIGYQPLFISAALRHLPLRGSMLSQDPAGTALRDVQLSTNTINAGTAATGA